LQKRLAEQTRMRNTFRSLRVYVNREVPLRSVYFVLLCGGVEEVGWERGASEDGGAGRGSAFASSAENITHQVVDRPPANLQTVPGREYIQPQWVFDSFNVGCQLPVALYAPGRAPPPHLSPFVDDEAEGYVPRQRELLDKLAQEAGVGSGNVATATGTSGGGKEAAANPAETAYDRFTEELKAEAKGMWHSEFKEKEEAQKKERIAAIAQAADEVSEEEEAPVRLPPGLVPDKPPPTEPAPKPTEEEEERLRAKALMSKKHKRLLSRIEYTAKSKEENSARLLKKRRKAEIAEKKAAE